MGTLSQHMPAELRLQAAKRWLASGAILRLTHPELSPKSDKYCVVVCDDQVPLVFRINSPNRPLVAKRPHLRATEYMLSKRAYPFLSYDSVLACGWALRCLSRKDICDQLCADPRRCLGHLLASDTRAILSIINTAKTLSGNERKRILGSLNRILAP